MALRLLRRHTALQKLRQRVTCRRHRGLLALAVLLLLLERYHLLLVLLSSKVLLLQLPLILNEGGKPRYIESGHAAPVYIVKP